MGDEFCLPLETRYRALSFGVAVRQAVRAKHRNYAYTNDASLGHWAAYASAYACAREGLTADTLVQLAKVPRRGTIAAALRGAVEGRRAALAQRIIDEWRTEADIEGTNDETAWTAVQLGMTVGWAKNAAIPLIAAGKFARGAAAIAQLPSEDARQEALRRVRIEAAWHGDRKAMLWLFSSAMPPARPLDIDCALQWMLRSGHGHVRFLFHLADIKRRLERPVCLCLDACEGGNVRAAAFVMKVLMSAGMDDALSILAQAACETLSLRILRWAATRMDRAILSQVMIANNVQGLCTIYVPAHASDRRLADAVQCAEFLLLFARAKPQLRPRLAFHTLDAQPKLRAAPCIRGSVLDRLAPLSAQIT